MNKNPIFQDLKKFNFDGKKVLEGIIQNSSYHTVKQAMASLSCFTHPKTVGQTRNMSVFKTIRGKNNSDRGKFLSNDGQKIFMLDDNTSPTDAFLWANKIKRNYRDVQFNHIWPDNGDGEIYTSLANICITPSFLAKLTDNDPEIVSLLRFRAFELFNGFKPQNEQEPEKPDGYDLLQWAEPLSPQENLEQNYRQAMSTKSANRAVIAAKEIGWYFSNYSPDLLL